MLSNEIVLAFCKHSDWAYQCWQIRKHLFDENPQQPLLKHPHYSYLFTRLALILQEHWLQEVAKLHDPATQGGNPNLSVNYILQHGAWKPEVHSKIQHLATQLEKLSKAIRTARNKLLSHNDLTTILSGTTLGEFDDGVDKEYFENLKTLVNVIHEEAVGGPFPFDELTENDVAIFMSAFAKGAT